jgi:hypothetical protein
MGEDIWQSALIGGAIGLAVVLVMAFIGSRRKPHFDAPPRRNVTVTSALPPAEALARIRKIPELNRKLAVVAEAPEKGLVVLSDSMSLASFGNFYPCFAKAAGAGSEIVVGIQPKAPQYGPVVSSKLKKVTEAVRTVVG